METLKEVANLIEQPVPINALEWEKLVNVSTHVGKMVRKAFVTDTSAPVGKKFKTEADTSAPVGKVVRKARGKKSKARGKKSKARAKKPTMYNGRVVSVSIAQEHFYYQWGPVTATDAYLVEYQDGDVEHMTADQVIEHHNAWLKFAQSAPSTAC